MPGKNTSPSKDLLIARIAARQWDLVTTGQLQALGLDDEAIALRLRSGRLTRVWRGVFRLGHAPMRLETRWLSAVLAAGSGAVLSHADAAALWEIRPSSAAAVHVTVPSQNGRARRRGLVIHRSRRLADQDVTVSSAIPVTTPARTLLDLADLLTDQPLKRAVDEADYRRLLNMSEVEATIARNPGRRGARVLRLAGEPEQRTRLGLEERFLSLCRRHGIGLPQVNGQVNGFEVDCFWPKASLIVELDGGAAHRTARAFERDRERDRKMLLAGLRTIRLTAAALKDERAVAEELRQHLRNAA